MIFLISKTSNKYTKTPTCPHLKAFSVYNSDSHNYGIDINSLDELLSLVDETGEDIIIGKVCKEVGKFKDNYYTLEIYDDYRELE